MKAFVVIAALIAVAAAKPNGYGQSSYGGSSYGQTIPMQSAGSPPVKNVPNNSYGYSHPVTYTAPGATYQAPPITYAAPMLTFHPPSINYRDQSITYATAAQEGYSSGGSYSAPAAQTHAYQPASSSYSAPAAPQMQSYQASSGY